jgi:hypothetical protein
MIFHRTERHLSKYHGSWVISITQNVKFNFPPPTVFLFLVSHESRLMKVVHLYKINIQNFTVPRWLAQVCIHLTSLNVCHFGDSWRYGTKVRHRGYPQPHELANEFHKIYQLVQKLMLGNRYADRKVISFLRKNGRLTINASFKYILIEPKMTR